jgi:DNA-binding transcriptional regulator WhiA
MTKNRYSCTEKEEEYIKKFYPSLDRNTLIKDLGRTWVSIKWHAKRLGISRPNIREAKLKKLLEQTVESAYWWGFIMSDGYLSNKGDLVFALSTKDENHLVKLSEYLGYPINIQRDVDVYMSRFSVMDKINGALLKTKLQITEKKTYNPPIDFSFLKTKEERLAFYIGFVDGDGSIQYDKKGTFKSIRIIVHGNWYNFWSSFCEQLTKDYSDLSFTVNNTNKRGNTSIYIGKKNTKHFLETFINENKLTILNRKWKLSN